MYSTLSPMSVLSFHIPKNEESLREGVLPFKRSAQGGTRTSTIVPSAILTSARGLKTPCSNLAAMVMVPSLGPCASQAAETCPLIYSSTKKKPRTHKAGLRHLSLKLLAEIPQLLTEGSNFFPQGLKFRFETSDPLVVLAGCGYSGLWFCRRAPLFPFA